MYVHNIITVTFSPTNNNTGHDYGPDNDLFDLQTPAVYFNLSKDQVHRYITFMTVHTTNY